MNVRFGLEEKKVICKANACCTESMNNVELYLLSVLILYYILKRKSFATLTKMLVPFFSPKQSPSDNAIDKYLYLPCIQHKKSEWCRFCLPSYNNNSKATPNFKVTWLQYFTCYPKNLF